MFLDTPIKGLFIYHPKIHQDHRGRFFESFNQKHFLDKGLSGHFVQDNRSTSTRGTLRGLHLQKGPHAQAKLVSVLKGSVYDVAVDLRPESTTFKQWYGIELTEHEPFSFYIPRGFAHGFVVLSETAEFFYKVDNFYNKESEGGIIYNDSDLAIDWKISSEQILLSDKDKILPTLKDFLG